MPASGDATVGDAARRERPRVAVTLQAPLHGRTPDAVATKNDLYVDALRRGGADPIALDERSTPRERADAWERMDGLLLTGGADLDPALYGEELNGSEPPEPGRDTLEREAWDAATRRGVPVLGICRGFQAINVFSGGRLMQHVTGHRRPGAPVGGEPMHELTLVPGTRLAGILDGGGGGEAPPTLSVNSSHHQAITREQVAPGLRIAGWSGEFVEAFESADPERWVIGVQCHPERTANTPAVFERLWSAFGEACRARVRDTAGTAGEPTPPVRVDAA